MADVTLRDWLKRTDQLVDGRLPAERKLCAILGVSRSHLRQELALLEAEGLIRRHVGRGTFLIHRREWKRPDAVDLARRVNPPDVMQVRSILEPEIAGLASRMATTAHIEQLRAQCSQMRDVKSWFDYQQLDSEFHAALADACGNGFLSEIHGLVNEVRRWVVWQKLDKRSAKPPPDYHSFDEHDAIVDAIERRDRSMAVAAMRRHLMSTERELWKD